MLLNRVHDRWMETSIVPVNCRWGFLNVQLKLLVAMLRKIDMASWWIIHSFFFASPPSKQENQRQHHILFVHVVVDRWNCFLGNMLQSSLRKKMDPMEQMLPLLLLQATKETARKTSRIIINLINHVWYPLIWRYLDEKLRLLYQEISRMKTKPGSVIFFLWISPFLGLCSRYTRFFLSSLARFGCYYFERERSQSAVEIARCLLVLAKWNVGYKYLFSEEWRNMESDWSFHLPRLAAPWCKAQLNLRFCFCVAPCVSIDLNHKFL